MPLVAERLDDPSSEVRRFGAGTLMTMAIAESGKRAMSHPSVLPKLAALMTDPDPFVEVRYFTLTCRSHSIFSVAKYSH